MKLYKNNILPVFPILFLVIVFIVCFNAGCKTRGKDSKDAAGARDPVTIGFAAILAAPVIIAHEKGYFFDEGLDVTMREYSAGKLALDGMFAGEVDLATVAETPVVFNSFKRDDFFILAMISSNADDLKIVVRKDRGIRKASDLKGRKIGTTFGTAAQFYLDSYLNISGLAKDDVTVINRTVSNLPADLQKGTVDAIATIEPYAYEARQLLGDNAMRLPKVDIYGIMYNLVTTKQFSKKHPETVKKVLKAIDKAVTFIQQNKKESLMITALKLKVDEKFLNAVWDDYIFGLSLDQSLLIAMEDQARWAIKNKLTDKTLVPNYLDYIYMGGLAAVKPEAVRIMR